MLMLNATSPEKRAVIPTHNPWPTAPKHMGRHFEKTLEVSFLTEWTDIMRTHGWIVEFTAKFCIG